MVKHIKLLMLFFIACIICKNSFAQGDFCSARNKSYKEGESLTFRVYYNMGMLWISAGNAVINVYSENFKGQKVYHIVGNGKTAKSYEWVFKVKDKYETYIDRITMLPIKFIRDVNEGGFKIKNNISFYQSKGKAVSDTTSFSIPKCTQDILSAIYFARNIDYNKHKVGDKIPFNLFLDNKIYALNIKYIGKETIQTKMGVYNTIKIVPQLIKGTIFKDADKMTVWVSDDENHIPLRVSSPILVGTIKVDIIGYDNLRNPFSSMVKEF